LSHGPRDDISSRNAHDTFMTETRTVQPPTARDRFAGCLLGGAVGDALGAPIEFMTRREIVRRFGAEGITGYARAYGGIGRITDDTQMTLFTAEGLLRAWVRSCFRGITTYPGVTAHAYLRWLMTQGEEPRCELDYADGMGWLFGHRELHARRAPGNTCLAALRGITPRGAPARNGSKGCGGVMRVAPVGLFARQLRDEEPRRAAFELATEIAALTHGHPTGSLTAGVLAVLILELAGGSALTGALAGAKACLRMKRRCEETLRSIEHAETLAGSGKPHEAAIAEIGEGWVAEEALAIAIYCALVARGFRHGVVLAVNHDGDSDSTGSIAGNLLGTMHGAGVIPAEWLEPLELRDVIREIADDLYAFKEWAIGEHAPDEALKRRIRAKYPGS
jgi:ADP-ribosylglycohydrolase